MRFSKAFFAFGLIISNPAWAGLDICNLTDIEASVSIGYAENEIWTSEGWWNIAAGDCVAVIEGDLNSRYYYWHARNDLGVFQAEDYSFCITPEVFTVKGDENCSSRGYEEVRFAEVDTGEARHFTINLELSDAPGHYGNPSPAISWATEGWPSAGGDLIKDLEGFYVSKYDPDLTISISGSVLKHHSPNGVTAQAELARLIECHGYERNALIEVDYVDREETCWEIIQINWDGFSFRTVPNGGVVQMLRAQ